MGDELYSCEFISWDYKLYHWQDGEPEEMYVIGLDIPLDTGYRGNWDDHDGIGYGVYGINSVSGVYSDNKSLYVYIFPPNGSFSELHSGKIEPLY